MLTAILDVGDSFCRFVTNIGNLNIVNNITAAEHNCYDSEAFNINHVTISLQQAKIDKNQKAIGTYEMWPLTQYRK